MQTFQAVSAGGLFTPGGVETPSSELAPTNSPIAPADFEQHLQQSHEGQPPPARPIAGKAAHAVNAECGEPHSATVAWPAPTIHGTRSPAVETELVATDGTWLQLPPRFAEPIASEPTPTTTDADATDAAAIEQSAVEMTAAITALASPYPQPTPMRPAVGRAAVDEATTETPANARGSAPTVGEHAPARSPADSIASATVAGDTIHASTARRQSGGPIPQTAEATPRSSEPARTPGSVETLQANRAGQVSDPPVQSPARPVIQHPAVATVPAPQRTNQPWAGSESDAAPAAPTPSREPSPRGVEADARRAIDVARFNPGSSENAAVHSALFRRASLIPFAGTTAAKLERSMDKSPEQNQFAGSPEQKLPVRGSSAPAAEFRPLTDRALESVREATGDPGGKRPGTWVELSAARPASVIDPTTHGVNGSGETAGVNATRTAEQLSQNLTREVAQFKRFNAESMAVVLKPDAQTEIFLHLASRNGQIEIQARFERGDFAALNGQWSQLQQSLSQQGVRLGALQEGFQQSAQQPANGGSAEWGHGQMNQGQQRPSQREADERANARAFDEFLLPGAPKETATRSDRVRSAGKRANAALEAWA